MMMLWMFSEIEKWIEVTVHVSGLIKEFLSVRRNEDEFFLSADLYKHDLTCIMMERCNGAFGSKPQRHGA